jgi:hypothetical protein
MASEVLQHAIESLKVAETEIRLWKSANQPVDPSHPVYVELKAEVCRAEVTACRAEVSLDRAACRAEVSLARATELDMSKQKTAQLAHQASLELTKRNIKLRRTLPSSSWNLRAEK